MVGSHRKHLDAPYPYWASGMRNAMLPPHTLTAVPLYTILVTIHFPGGHAKVNNGVSAYRKAPSHDSGHGLPLGPCKPVFSGSIYRSRYRIRPWLFLWELRLRWQLVTYRYVRDFFFCQRFHYFPYFNKPAAQVHGDSPSWSSLSGQTAIIILLRLLRILIISLLGLGCLHFEAGKVRGLSGLKNMAQSPSFNICNR